MRRYGGAATDATATTRHNDSAIHKNNATVAAAPPTPPRPRLDTPPTIKAPYLRKDSQIECTGRKTAQGIQRRPTRRVESAKWADSAPGNCRELVCTAVSCDRKNRRESSATRTWGATTQRSVLVTATALQRRSLTRCRSATQTVRRVVGSASARAASQRCGECRRLRPREQLMQRSQMQRRRCHQPLRLHCHHRHVR